MTTQPEKIIYSSISDPAKWNDPSIQFSSAGDATRAAQLLNATIGKAEAAIHALYAPLVEAAEATAQDGCACKTHEGMLEDALNNLKERNK